MVIRLFVFISFIGLFTHLQAQKIALNIDQRPLNKVLLDLREDYNLQISFNNRLLEQCIVSNHSTYSSPEEAIKALTLACHFAYKIKNEVFIIIALDVKQESKELEHKGDFNYQFSGTLVDKESGESLPYANILIGQSGMVSDQNGRFSYSGKDSAVPIKISYLGYYIVDSTIHSSSNHIMQLKLSLVKMDEVVIEKKQFEENVHIGKQAGLMKITHKLADQVPGSSDQTIFNLLRLQPGILAAGEQTQDYMIWGAYKGQTQILFDGISLFNITNLQDNVGAVNPLMIKSMEVMKGGYNSQIGGRVGGVVKITGLDGNANKLEGDLNINTQTVNGRVNVPVGKRASFQLSFRQSYNNTEAASDEEIISEQNKSVNEKDDKEEGKGNEKASDDEKKTEAIKTFPSNYNFQDLNLKFGGENKWNDRYFISFLAANDRNRGRVIKSLDDTDASYVSIDNLNVKQQYGSSVFYGKRWRNGGITNTTFATSTLTSSFERIFEFNYASKATEEVVYSETSGNNIAEMSFKVEHLFPTKKRHSTVVGGGLIRNWSYFGQTSFNKESDKSNVISMNRLSLFAKDKVSLSNYLKVEPGLRFDYVPGMNQVFFQPRINMVASLFKHWKFNLAFGRYRQFINEIAIVDALGNYQYYWDIINTEANFVLNSYHYIAGLSYSKPKFNISIESFYKTLNGLQRFIFINEEGFGQSFGGIGYAYGLDFYVKKDIKKHNFWVAYTWSKSLEYFTYFALEQLRYAPQDQRHELKGASLFNFHPFYFSFSYVYGSGLPEMDKEVSERISYHRLDVAALYKFKFRKMKLETGASILNVMNIKNIRYNNFILLEGNEKVYAEAMPFTPMVFLNIKF